ncbi:alpha/beta hydrolase family protein [uncultured Amnibacterium sp.]|uniref:alpha/beta hydrolase family protein n=1 Tax=uncultured Amnibacterium sp. TaxID=1631851 RepID=UPI0035CA84AD
MPLRRPQRRAGGIVAALLVAATLSGCAAGTVAGATPSPVQKTVDPVDPAALRAQGARIVDDDASSSLVVAPKRPNGALVVFLHGWGQTRWSLLSRKEEAGVATALTDTGFTLLSADAGGKAWGDPASLQDYTTLISRARRTYDLRDVFLMGESMGGLATMQLARTLPDVRAVTAWFPVCDLSTMHEERFQQTIGDAWRGRSRAPVAPVEVGDAPMLVWASASDTVVDAATNAAVCVARARAAGADVTYYRTTGGHGDPSNYQPATIVQFFERHRSPGA